MVASGSPGAKAAPEKKGTSLKLPLAFAAGALLGYAVAKA